MDNPPLHCPPRESDRLQEVRPICKGRCAACAACHLRFQSAKHTYVGLQCLMYICIDQIKKKKKRETCTNDQSTQVIVDGRFSHPCLRYCESASVSSFDGPAKRLFERIHHVLQVLEQAYFLAVLEEPRGRGSLIRCKSVNSSASSRYE